MSTAGPYLEPWAPSGGRSGASPPLRADVQAPPPTWWGASRRWRDPSALRSRRWGAQRHQVCSSHACTGDQAHVHPPSTFTEPLLSRAQSADI